MPSWFRFFLNSRWSFLSVETWNNSLESFNVVNNVKQVSDGNDFAFVEHSRISFRTCLRFNFIQASYQPTLNVSIIKLSIA